MFGRSLTLDVDSKFLRTSIRNNNKGKQFWRVCYDIWWNSMALNERKMVVNRWKKRGERMIEDQMRLRGSGSCSLVSWSKYIHERYMDETLDRMVVKKRSEGDDTITLFLADVNLRSVACCGVWRSERVQGLPKGKPGSWWNIWKEKCNTRSVLELILDNPTLYQYTAPSCHPQCPGHTSLPIQVTSQPPV